MKSDIKYTKYFDNCLAVFQGGGCKAISYVGAYKEAQARGVIFNELAGTSAGSIVAALIAAGASPEDLEKFIKGNIKTIQSIIGSDGKKLNCKEKLINFIAKKLAKRFVQGTLLKHIDSYLANHAVNEFFSKKGAYNMNVLHNIIDTALKDLLKVDHSVEFKELITNLHVVASDVKNKEIVVWNKNNCKNMTVADAVCASCSIPLFFQPYRNRYVDGGILSNLPNFVFSERPKYTNRLCFLPTSDVTEIDKPSFGKYLGSIIDTITDGAAKVQQNMIHGSHFIEIPVGDTRSTDFKDLDSQLIDKLITSGENAVKIFLDKENDYNPFEKQKPNEIHTEEELYTYISTLSYQKIDEVFVSSYSNKWIWKLFPTLLKWVENNAIVTIYSSKKADNEYEQARLRLAQKLNCTVHQEDAIPAYVFFLRIDSQWQGFIYNCDKKGGFLNGLLYEHTIDAIAIETAMQKFGDAPSGQKHSEYKGIKQVDDVVIFNVLGKLDVYQSADFRMENIDIKDIKFMNNQIRLSKYRQINKLFSLYEKEDIDLFENTEIVFKDNAISLVCPVVIEETKDGEYVIIEGKTRVLYAYHHGISSIKAVIVRNVNKPLPYDTAKPFKTVKEIIVTDSKKDIRSQYESLYRHIEECMHPSKLYLLDNKKQNQYKMEDLYLTTSFEEFFERCDLSEQELLYMCDTIFHNTNYPSFKIEPAPKGDKNVMIVYEPYNIGLILTSKAKNYIIKWIEEKKLYGEPYDDYLNWKMAVEKDD